MDIRKADSKGRLTGFTPGLHYKFRDNGATVQAEALLDLDEVLNPNNMDETPVPARKYLNRLGIDIAVMSREGVMKEGYSEFVQDEYGRKVLDHGMARIVRKPWPEGFNWDEFVSLVTGE